ncbi:endochitinase-like [Anopheles bellator]|uniref:endochitinase-like n=1 Tax=Anopheles bellator TaxID=139047 RepID=UPI0026498D88|nr:endochitinase-like [Anopheles bellator]
MGLKVHRRCCALLALLIVALLPQLIKSQSKRLVCGYGSDSAAQDGYPPDYIPLEVCKDVIFKAFWFPKTVGRQMLFNDNDKRAFSNLVSSVRRRSSNARVIASIKGSQIDYSTVASIGSRRRAFVQVVGTLLLELDADGVEINWNYPGGTQEFGGSDFDRISMVLLLQDLRQMVTAASGSIRGRNRELWFRVSIHPNAITDSYNVPEVCELADVVTVDAKEVTGGDSHAPMHSKPIQLPRIPAALGGISLPQTIDNKYDITDSTQLWIDNGCPPKKMLLAIALFGVSYQYSNMYANFFGSSFSNLRSLGTVKKVEPYRKLCESLRQYGWSRRWDPYGLMPYATRIVQSGLEERVSYDDVTSLRYKMDLVQQKRLGGVYLDYVHWDDVYGRCGAQSYPLTSYVASRLQSIPSDIGFAIEWS